MKEKGERKKERKGVLLGDVFPRGEQREKRKKEKEEPILKIHVIMDIMWRGKLGIERRGVDDYTALLDKRVGQNIKALGSLHITRDMFRVLQHFGKAPFPWSDTHAPRLLLQSSMQTFINTCFIFFLQTHAYLLADAVLFSFSAPCRLPI